jgi:hypothetical protein
MVPASRFQALLLAFVCSLCCLTTQTTLAFAPIAVATTATRVALQSSSSTALQVAVDTSEIKNGLTVELNGEPHKVWYELEYIQIFYRLKKCFPCQQSTNLSDERNSTCWTFCLHVYTNACLLFYKT